MENSQTPSYLPTPHEDLLKKLEEFLFEHVKREIQPPLSDQITKTLQDFEQSLGQKIQAKTLEALITHLSAKENHWAQVISEEFLRLYSQKLLQKASEEKPPTLPTPSSSSEKQVDVYLGYEPNIKVAETSISSSTKTSSEPEALSQLSATPSSQKEPSLSEKRAFYDKALIFLFHRRFLFLLLLSSFIWILVGVYILTLSMPFVFLRVPSPLLALGTMLICITWVNTSEARFFRQRGLFISLHENRLIFRSIIYLMKVLVAVIPLSFLFLMDVRFHNPYLALEQPAMSLYGWWIMRTNEIFYTLFALVSPMGVLLLQKILYYGSLIGVGVCILQWIFRKPEII